MYLMDMYVRGGLEEQGCRQAKGRTQHATSNEEVQKAEGDQDCCAHSQARLISQLLHPCSSRLTDNANHALLVLTTMIPVTIVTRWYQQLAEPRLYA